MLQFKCLNLKSFQFAKDKFICARLNSDEVELPWQRGSQEVTSYKPSSVSEHILLKCERFPVKHDKRNDAQIIGVALFSF